MSEENKTNIINSKAFKSFFDYIEKHSFVVSSICVGALTILSNVYYFYEYAFQCGYFRYFGMDDSYFLNTESNAVMFLANCILIGMLIFAYVYTAINVLRNSGPIKWKIGYCLVVPIIVEFIYLFIKGIDFYTVDFWLLLLALYILYIIWFLWMAGYSLKNFFELFRGNTCDQSDKQSRINDIIGRILPILLLVVLMGIWVEHVGCDAAKQKRNFGIVTVENHTYAIIKNDGNDMVLKKCEINDNSLTIYQSSYLKEKNDKEVRIITFKNVVLK